RELSIFVGAFTLEAAQAIAPGAELDALVGKSLVWTLQTNEGPVIYRLLETTRLYAARKLEENGEVDATAERHAEYFLRLLQNSASPQPEQLGNLRAALEWCFGRSNCPIGIDLAAVSAPLFLALSLWNECRRWSQAALARFDDAMRGDKRE